MSCKRTEVRRQGVRKNVMEYRRRFRKYISDLSARKPAPGGGSAVCLSFCLGISLIQKAINYSSDKDGRLKIKNNRIRAERYITALDKLKENVFLYIDLDGQIFSKLMQSAAEARKQAVKESQTLLVDTGKASLKAFSLAKEIESGIKKSIISDFFIGLEYIKLTLLGCIANLEANASIFGQER